MFAPVTRQARMPDVQSAEIRGGRDSVEPGEWTRQNPVRDQDDGPRAIAAGRFRRLNRSRPTTLWGIFPLFPIHPARIPPLFVPVTTFVVPTSHWDRSTITGDDYGRRGVRASSFGFLSNFRLREATAAGQVGISSIVIFLAPSWGSAFPASQSSTSTSRAQGGVSVGLK